MIEILKLDFNTKINNLDINTFENITEMLKRKIDKHLMIIAYTMRKQNYKNVIHNLVKNQTTAKKIFLPEFSVTEGDVFFVWRGKKED